MIELESSLHLYQLPLYRGTGSSWKASFLEAINDCDRNITWDPAAILAILEFHYACGDRTLVNEVKRRPWMSSIGPHNEPYFEDIPNHGTIWETPGQIAENLGRLLYYEALGVCEGKKEIYLLLSGGLDSRIVAGILAKLYREGRLATKPIAVTWGLEDSRDVVYGRLVAEILGFEWRHVNIGHEDLAYNVEKMAIPIGALVSPMDLHCTSWFKNVSPDALVLAASYGDSIGRAEFSGRHLLEVDYIRPVNTFRLLQNKVLASAFDGITHDLRSLHDRSPNQAKYVICELEQQGHYMRNMIGHAMSGIRQYCYIYQMFTHPKTYSYMWSIHPTLRNDAVYAELLTNLDTRIARVPWARTDRALKYKTVGAKPGLRKDFHDYTSWVSGPLFDRLHQYIDPVWFAETGIFDSDRIRNLTETVRLCRERKPSNGIKICQTWLCLAAFRQLAEHLEGMGKSIELDETAVSYSSCAPFPMPKTKQKHAKLALSRSDFLCNIMGRCQELLKKIRRIKLKRQAVRKYPPLKKTSYS